LVKRTPGVNRIAGAWWRRVQTRAFEDALRSLPLPVIPFPAGALQEKVDVPTPEEIANRNPETIDAGDKFSTEMSAWCSTSKFVSLGYQDVYGRILSHFRTGPCRVLEVGIGVNDPTVPSGMHAGHAPGSSLRGWSHYLKDSEVHGADIDVRTLIDTDRYVTHRVDQRDLLSLLELGSLLTAPIDLAIDDGLHTPEANGKTVAALLPLISPHGIMIVEDILPEFDFLWESLPVWLNDAYHVTFYPSRILRQERPPGSESGIAVFTRQIPPPAG
jgi:hypothetical protein